MPSGERLGSGWALRQAAARSGDGSGKNGVWVSRGSRVMGSPNFECRGLNEGGRSSRVLGPPSSFRWVVGEGAAEPHLGMSLVVGSVGRSSRTMFWPALEKAAEPWDGLPLAARRA